MILPLMVLSHLLFACDRRFEGRGVEAQLAVEVVEWRAGGRGVSERSRR